MTKPKYWTKQLSACDFCDQPIHHKLYDGATIHRVWATMCLPCFRRHGVGLGLGRGQEYLEQADGRWRKING
jgi:hypothetical protein